MSFETAVQTAVYQALVGDAALMALVSGVFDNVPQDTEFPYVTVGEDVHNEWDTVDTLGSDCSLTIHSWSRRLGRKETKQIQGAIYNALHRQTLVYGGYEFTMSNWEGSQSFMDADALTRHGVVTVRILVDKA